MRIGAQRSTAAAAQKTLEGTMLGAWVTLLKLSVTADNLLRLKKQDVAGFQRQVFSQGALQGLRTELAYTRDALLIDADPAANALGRKISAEIEPLVMQMFQNLWPVMPSFNDPLAQDLLVFAEKTQKLARSLQVPEDHKSLRR